MEIAHQSGSSLAQARKIKPLALSTLGAVISILLILNGVVFQTYQISMASPPLEAARQFGLLYILAEIGVILYSLRQELDLRALWSGLPRFARYCGIFFVSIFWIGGAIQSESSLFAIVQNIIFLIHALFGLAVYHAVSRVDASGMHKLVIALATGLLIFCGMTAFAFLNHPPLDTMPNNQIVWQFIIPGFISVRLFGAFCGAIFCLLLAQLLLDEEAGPTRRWSYVWLTICATMIVWSGTRNAVLGIAVAMFVMMIFYRLRPNNIKVVMLLILSMVIAVWLAGRLVPYNDPAFMFIAGEDSASVESISGRRASYWSAVWSAYQTVPIFGAGPFASFWIVPEGAQTHVQPHNIVLQFLISWGAPATVCAFALLAFTTWKAHVVALYHRSILPFLAMLDCLLVMSFFDGMFHFAQPLMLIMIAFGVIFSAGKTDKSRPAGV